MDCSAVVRHGSFNVVMGGPSAGVNVAAAAWRWPLAPSPSSGAVVAGLVASRALSSVGIGGAIAARSIYLHGMGPVMASLALERARIAQAIKDNGR